MKRSWNIVLGIIIIIYIILINLVSSATIAFSIPFIGLGLIFIFYNLINNRIQMNKFLSSYFNLMKIIMVVLLICFLGLEAAIVSYLKKK